MLKLNTIKKVYTHGSIRAIGACPKGCCLATPNSSDDYSLSLTVIRPDFREFFDLAVATNQYADALFNGLLNWLSASTPEQP